MQYQTLQESESLNFKQRLGAACGLLLAGVMMIGTLGSALKIGSNIKQNDRLQDDTNEKICQLVRAATRQLVSQPLSGQQPSAMAR